MLQMYLTSSSNTLKQRFLNNVCVVRRIVYYTNTQQQQLLQLCYSEMHSSKDGRTNFNKSRLEFADDIVVVVVVAKELSHILRQQRQKQLWSCSNSTKLLYGPRTKKASSLYVRTTSKLLSTYLANGWLVAKAVVLGHFLEFSDRQQSSRPIILLPSRRSSLIVNATRGKPFFWYQRNSLVEEDVC